MSEAFGFTRVEVWPVDDESYLATFGISCLGSEIRLI